MKKLLVILKMAITVYQKLGYVNPQSNLLCEIIKVVKSGI